MLWVILQAKTTQIFKFQLHHLLLFFVSNDCTLILFCFLHFAGSANSVDVWCCFVFFSFGRLWHFKLSSRTFKGQRVHLLIKKTIIRLVSDNNKHSVQPLLFFGEIFICLAWIISTNMTSNLLWIRGAPGGLFCLNLCSVWLIVEVSLGELRRLATSEQHAHLPW